MQKTWSMSSFYFYVFFSFGGLFSLLSLYLKNEAHLSGTQIGTIMSLGPIVMILSQPFWGVICDYTKKPRLVLTFTVFLTGIAGLGYLVSTSYIWIFIVAIILAFFQSAIVPISDSLVTNYVYEHQKSYGSIRSWGAVGYSISVLAVAKISEVFGSQSIFICFAIALVIASWYATKIPEPKRDTNLHANLLVGLKELFRLPPYLLFLFVTFFVFGPIYANNFYFGLLFESIGGTVAGIGIAFLLMAGSEVPFMKWADRFINRFGIMRILFLAAMVSAFRWFLYFFEPSQMVVYMTSILQGFSIGLFIPAALRFVKMIAPENVQVTAVSFYSAAGNGLGCWFCTIMGGILIDYFSIFTTYMFYGVLTTIGLVCLFFLKKMEGTWEGTTTS
ncbi:PPP family 3-phenylpropionic acid transporter [Salirhabdus euzebyi]|uniref:PPP family 3-phenylpropionic acid transporter n=1 Tax=Salirhabdus euzebyi TaxID=394506 RepID=A0A841PV02_9BACI|nr:MFS transporter [Salirhabdus euzebyi]MBB6452837.1 PPP family 3-phenylpropionic acid transporter [Salirhabdus euzebyi]